MKETWQQVKYGRGILSTSILLVLSVNKYDRKSSLKLCRTAALCFNINTPSITKNINNHLSQIGSGNH